VIRLAEILLPTSRVLVTQPATPPKFTAFYTLFMEAIKIIATCLLAGSMYGILHDRVTARVCLEYFTVFHPDVFHTQSPTLLAFGWGILATWWASLFVGLALAMVARLGSRPRFSADELVPRVALLMAAMALFALVAGVSGYFLQGLGMEYYATNIPKQIRHAFLLGRIRRRVGALRIGVANAGERQPPGSLRLAPHKRTCRTFVEGQITFTKPT
jgi:hypothetical protein